MSNLADFRVRFPEFIDVPDPQVSAALQDATLELAPTVWNTISPLFQPDGITPIVTPGVFTQGDLGQMWLAAHNLAMTPFGQNARMVAPDGTGSKSTTYEVAYRRLQREVSAGFRVTL